MTAVDELLARYESLITARVRACAYPSDDRDDLKQRARLRLVSSMERFDRTTTERTWAQNAIDWAIKDVHKEQRRALKYAHGYPASLDAIVGDGSSSLLDFLGVEEDFSTAETDRLAIIQEVRAAVRALPPSERLVVMNEARGFRLHDSARHLGVTESRACQLRQRAFARLRARLRSVEEAV